MKYYLGLDCGGTVIKAAIFDRTLKEIATAREHLEVISDKLGYAERDLTKLQQSLISVITKVITASNLNPLAIDALGISGYGKGLITLDSYGNPLGRAILSSDQRSIEVVKSWQRQGIDSALYPLTRQKLWTGHPVSLLKYLKEYDRLRYDKSTTILMQHDYLRYLLTGTIGVEQTNISESNLYLIKEGTFSQKLADMLGLAEVLEKIPPVVKSNEVVGQITYEMAAKTGLSPQTKVVGGLFDVVASAICADLVPEVDINMILGTWTVVSGITSQLDNDPLSLVYGKYADDKHYIIHEASPTSIANVEWFLAAFNMDYHHLNQALLTKHQSDQGIYFAPFLYGSNASLGMRAAVYGLTSAHQTTDLIRAVCEGVIFSAMIHLHKIKERFDKATMLKVTGGAVQSLTLMQMLADISHMPLAIIPIRETGCLGAALMAMGDDAPTRLNHHLRIIEPNPQQAVFYAQKFANYQKFIAHISDFHHSINHS